MYSNADIILRSGSPWAGAVPSRPQRPCGNSATHGSAAGTEHIHRIDIEVHLNLKFLSLVSVLLKRDVGEASHAFLGAFGDGLSFATLFQSSGCALQFVDLSDQSSDQLASKELALQALDTRLERWDLRVNKQLSSSLPKASAFCERRRHEKACCR